MSLIVFVVVAGVFAGLALGVRARPRVVNAVGIIGLGATLVAAILIQPGQVVVVEGGGLATTAYLRLFLILGSLVGLGLAVTGLAGGSRRDAPAVTLGILATGGLTLGLVDPRAAVLVATAGGLFGVLVTLLPTNGRAGATVGIRETRAVDRLRGPGDRRDGVVRARPEPAGGPAGRLRAGLPGLRGRGRHAVRRDPVPPVGGAAQRCRARGRPADPDGAGPGHPRDRRPRLDGRIGRAAARRPLGGPADRAVDRDRVDRPRRRGRVRAGRHRARAQLFDRRRRRCGDARPGHPGPRRMGAGPDVDPRLRRGPQRVRGLGGRDPGGLLHGAGGRPSGLGPSLADPRRRARRRRHRGHRLAGDRVLRLTGGPRRAGPRRAAGDVRPRGHAGAARVLRAAARDRPDGARPCRRADRCRGVRA